MWNKRRKRQAFGVSSSNGRQKQQPVPTVDSRRGRGSAQVDFFGRVLRCYNAENKAFIPAISRTQTGSGPVPKKQLQKQRQQPFAGEGATDAKGREQQIPRNCGSE